MSVTVNVQAAKTRLSELLHRAEAGEEIVISRAGRAVVTLQPVAPRRRSFALPLLTGLREIPLDAFLQPMPDDDLHDWEEGHPGDPLGGGDHR